MEVRGRGIGRSRGITVPPPWRLLNESNPSSGYEGGWMSGEPQEGSKDDIESPRASERSTAPMLLRAGKRRACIGRECPRRLRDAVTLVPLEWTLARHHPHGGWIHRWSSFRCGGAERWLYTDVETPPRQTGRPSALWAPVRYHRSVLCEPVHCKRRRVPEREPGLSPRVHRAPSRIRTSDRSEHLSDGNDG